MSLKDYQSEVLDRYEAFLHAWRAQAEANPGNRQASRLAFEQCTQANFGFRIPYHAPEALAADDVPVVCLRVPTGGGKTLIGGHAIARFKPTEWLEARVNVNNLTDKRYYDAIYRSGSPFAYIAPGRSAFLTLAVKM